MTDSEQHVADSIEQWVWSGFYTHDDIERMTEDIVDDDCDVDGMKSLIGPKLREKQKAERSWPVLTDCDRLDKVFHDLHQQGVCALANAGYTMSDGYSDVAEAVAQAPESHYTGFCFYHGQDVERAVEGDGVMLAFGDLADDEARSVRVGQVIAEALRQAGFQVDWDGSTQTRINLPVFDWKRRTAPQA